MARLSLAAISPIPREARNVAAGLDTIARCEGTWHRGDDGYNIVVGGTYFSNGYVDHPKIMVDLPHMGIQSSAAGRYQFLKRTWFGLAKAHGYTDFRPETQDRGAIELIRGRKALDDLKRGLIGNFIDKCCPEWASLPGAGYGQHEWSREQVIAWFKEFGGVLYEFGNVQGGAT